MSDLLDLICAHTEDPDQSADLVQAVAVHTQALLASAGHGDRQQVGLTEAAVQADPASAFAFDSAGAATLMAAGSSWRAGRFQTPTLGELRARVAARITGFATGQARLWVLDGAAPATDIGSLQATSGQGTLFQVASQFNCLEAPGPFLVPVASYFNDFTQGPRASISAFPAILLRHYAAPGPEGTRFMQAHDGPQVDLLRDACGPGVVRNGYVTGLGVTDPAALSVVLEERFDYLRIGVHDHAQVVLGYNWDGAVIGSPLIAQAFTSTVAGGSYGGQLALGPAFEPICRQLLRAAYLGTLLAALDLQRSRVVLTLIGGGVFHNPLPLIWESLLWAMAEVDSLMAHDLEVVVNGWKGIRKLDLPSQVLPQVRDRDGAILRFNKAGLVAIQR